MSNVELATAYIALVPSMQGAQGKIAEALLPAGNEGKKAGEKSGGMFAEGFSGTLSAAQIGVVATGAAVAGAAVGLYQVGAVFDDVADTIRVGTGASGDALNGLVDVAKQVGATVPTTFEKAGSTVSDLNQRLGLSGDTLSTVAQQYIQAGNILGQDVDIKSSTAAFSAFGIKGADVEGAMDSLFRVSQATGVGMNDLASQVQTSGAALKNLGFNFEDTASLAGVLDKSGLNASAVMASMGKGLVTLAKKGEEPQAAFKRVTGELGEFVKKGDTAGALNLAGKIFGTKGAAQFVGAIQSGKVNLEDLAGSAGQTTDTILGLGQDTADAAESWELLKNKALLALEPMGTAVFNFAGDALGFLVDNLDGVTKNIGDFGTEAGKIITLLTTGDFSGPIFGLEEDSGLVDFLFNVRDGVTNVSTAVQNVASWVKTDMMPALQTFGGWLVENKDTIANVATGITVLMLPALVRLGITALVSGAQQVIAWTLAQGGAIKTGVVYLAQSYLIIGRWVAMGAAAIASGAETVAIWALYQIEAVKGAIAYGVQSARVAAAWVAMSAAAVASGIKTAAVWVVQVVATAATSVVSFLVQTALVVGGWVAMAAAATANAIGMAAGWVIGVVTPAAIAGIAFLVGVATIVGGWIAMAAGAVVNAAIMAASWLIAFWPVALIAAIVIALVALIIMNWEAISTTTVAVFGAVVSFLTDTWNNIVNGVSGMIGNVVGFFTGLGDQIWGALSGAGTWLFEAGKNIVQGLFDGIRSLAGTIGNFFLGLLPGWIVEPFKLALGIHSPSTVFRGYGRNIGQGVILGVGDEQAGIDKATSSMVTVPDVDGYSMANRGKTMRSTAGGYRGGAGGHGGPLVEQHIHPQPGMSEHTIGNVSAREITHKMREHR